MNSKSRKQFLANALALPMVGRLVTSAELPYRIGRSLAWVYKAEDSGTFPRRIKTGTRSVAWRGDEIQDWLDSLERAE